MREERRKGILPTEMNCFYDQDYDIVYVDTSKGRARRPLIIIENGKSKLTEKYIEDLKNNVIKWDKLVKDGIIEYVDASEEENCYIALDENELTKEHTHLEISPITNSSSVENNVNLRTE